jgi:hypothetical protein
MSVAEIESTNVGASFFTSCEVAIATRAPTMTTSCSGGSEESLGASLALLGAVKASPDAHANARNTAIRTDLLIVLMHTPLVV